MRLCRRCLRKASVVQLMKTFLKIIGWITAALAGLFVWHAFPDIQPAVTWAVLAVIVYHVVSNIVRETIRSELTELNRQIRAHTTQLEDIERKVSAVLRDVLERRRAGH